MERDFAEAERLSISHKIFHWKTKDEREQEENEENIRDNMDNPDDYHSLFDGGVRSPTDMLPGYECTHAFLSYQIADGDPIKFDYLMNKTYSELKLLYGYYRTRLYLSIDDKKHNNDWRSLF